MMKSVGERELAWLQNFAKPRLPREPIYRAINDYKEASPNVQKQNLRDYLTLVPLVIPGQAEFNKPTIRHPDLSPSNIFISNSGEITGLIDWQHASVMPLFLQAKIPKHFQNWGDEDSENSRPPRLPENYEELDENEQSHALERYRRRQVHYFYVNYTNRHNEAHSKVLDLPHLVITNKLYTTAASPWEGDNISLKAGIIALSKGWTKVPHFHIRGPFPIKYTQSEITQSLDINKKQQEGDVDMQLLRRCFTTNIQGWVSLELYDQARARVEDVRQQMIDLLDTDDEKKELEEHWPFQDHVEIE
jgi:hypothetical protein